MNKNIIIFRILAIVLFGFAVYVNSLNGAFLWDDWYLIKDNMYIKNWSNAANIFITTIGTGGNGKQCFFYRPLQALTYMIEYRLWKFDSRWYHLTNIILHILTALSLYWLVKILYDDRLVASLASLLFITHPVHTEAVAYISGRADPLSALFMLISIILYIKQSENDAPRVSAVENHIGGYAHGSRYPLQDPVLFVIMLLSYLAALFSKESSLILPVLLLVYHYAFKKKISRGPFVSLTATACFYILFRMLFLKSVTILPAALENPLERIPGFFAAIAGYIRLLLLPFNLHMEYGSKLFSFNDPIVITGAASALLLFIYAFRKRDKFSSFCILWFFAALLPVSNIYGINAYMAEHWLYVPSMGFFIILARILSRLYSNISSKTAAVIITGCFLSFYSYLTVKQNEYWQEPLSFYERTAHYAPGSVRVYNNLGIIYRERGRYPEAIAALEKTIQLKPDFSDAYNNLAVVYSFMGNNAHAISLYKKAIAIAPWNSDPYNNLGVAYSLTGRDEDAIKLFTKAIEINPNYEKAYNNLGNQYRNKGKNEEALTLYKKAISINPDSFEAYNNIGVLYSMTGRDDEAVFMYNKAIEINPVYVDAYGNLGTLYASMGNKDKAIALYKKATEISPQYVTGYQNLAGIYYREKQYDLAAVYYKKALELGAKKDPEFEGLIGYNETRR